MYQVMKRALLFPSLLLLVSAAPATRPVEATERLIVQVRHVEYAPKPNAAANNLSTLVADIPAEAKEISSLEVLTEAAAPFETVAVVNGTRYSFSGKLKRSMPSSDGKTYARLEFDYRETRAKDPGSIVQVTSNVMLVPGEPVRIGGFMRDPIVIGLILTLKQADAVPPR